jgi:ubiquinone/menaquinone biosynthesis C-methylase UbiE
MALLSRQYPLRILAYTQTETTEAMPELTRWQKFYLDDPNILSIPNTECARQAVELFQKHHVHTILDLGCGTGRDTLPFAQQGMTVFGIDAAGSGLLLAQKRMLDTGCGLNLTQADARRLPFADTSFEGVYCFGLLHEFTGITARDDVRSVLSEIYRVLQSFGMLILAVIAGEPEQGLPHVQMFDEQMFDQATSLFQRIDKRLYSDIGCTGRSDYKVWYGQFVRG